MVFARKAGTSQFWLLSTFLFIGLTLASSQNLPDQDVHWVPNKALTDLAIRLSQGRRQRRFIHGSK